MTIRDTIRTLVSDSGISLRDLADASGVSRTQLGDFLTGRKDATSQKIDALLAALAHELVAKKKPK